jgi:GAF domain-containing protein
VFVEGRWWGFIGFDACRSEREWSPGDIDTLKTLAALVGAAVTHTRGLQKLSDANRIIENSPTILSNACVGSIARPKFPCWKH